MSKAGRLTLVALAVVVVIAAFLIARPGDDDGDERAATTTDVPTATETATTPTATAPSAPEPPPDGPSATVIELSGYAVDEVTDLGAELLGQRLQRVAGVLDGVVQQRRDQRGGVHADLRGDRRHRQRVRDVRVPRLTEHPLMQMLRQIIGAGEHLRVRPRVELAVDRQQRVENGFVFALVPVRERARRADMPRTPTLERGRLRSVIR